MSDESPNSAGHRLRLEDLLFPNIRPVQSLVKYVVRHADRLPPVEVAALEQLLRSRLKNPRGRLDNLSDLLLEERTLRMFIFDRHREVLRGMATAWCSLNADEIETLTSRLGMTADAFRPTRKQFNTLLEQSAERGLSSFRPWACLVAMWANVGSSFFAGNHPGRTFAYRAARAGQRRGWTG